VHPHVEQRLRNLARELCQQLDPETRDRLCEFLVDLVPGEPEIPTTKEEKAALLLNLLEAGQPRH
jgi:hypothetical protein